MGSCERNKAKGREPGKGDAKHGGKIKGEVGTAMHMKWEEMKVGVRREISEEVQRRLALSNQQNEGEHVMMKKK